MKCRIIQDETLFVPQYRSFFFWRNFDKIREFMGFTYYSKEAFFNLDDAKKFLDGQIREKQSAKNPITIFKYP